MENLGVRGAGRELGNGFSRDAPGPGGASVSMEKRESAGNTRLGLSPASPHLRGIPIFPPSRRFQEGRAQESSRAAMLQRQFQFAFPTKSRREWERQPAAEVGKSALSSGSLGIPSLGRILEFRLSSAGVKRILKLPPILKNADPSRGSRRCLHGCGKLEAEAGAGRALSATGAGFGNESLNPHPIPQNQPTPPPNRWKSLSHPCK